LDVWVDDVAERAAAVGGNPDGRAATVTATSKVEDLEGGPIAADKVVVLVGDRITAAARRIEAALPGLDQDMPTQDLLIEVVAGLDKAAWMLHAQEK
jgi:starvation-inducible DNA-binding protein